MSKSSDQSVKKSLILLPMVAILPGAKKGSKIVQKKVDSLAGF